MTDDLHKEIEGLKRRIASAEWGTLAACAGLCLALRFNFIDWGWFLALVIGFQIAKLVWKRKLKQKEYLVREVENRTREIRSEKDAIQEESEKLSAALKALAEAQDELVRKERMATVGELTQGLVDRILNPLNYINNFASLTAGLVKELGEDLKSQRGRMEPDVYADSEELIRMMEGNLSKIAEHGFNTVRIVKAMEELLRERRGTLTLANINDLCRVVIDQVRKSDERQIVERHIEIRFERLALPLMLEVNVVQLSKALGGLLKNAVYAVVRRAEQAPADYHPEICLALKLVDDRLRITLRDNGTGIDEAIRDKIFAPFFTTKPTGEAAGIGLYLCREIIQNHRGTISVESRKGEYTLFEIDIPVYQPKKPAKDTPSNDKE